MRVLLVALCFFWSFLAFADRVPPPPESCPPGSIGDTGHEGPHCVPLSCSVDADCKDGGLCKETPLCLEEKMLAPGDNPEKSLYVFVEGVCEDASTCKAPASCKPGKRCVKPTKTAVAPTPAAENKAPSKEGAAKSGGCAVSSGGSASGLGLGLFVLGLLGWRRRAR